MRSSILFILMLTAVNLYAPPNCEIYKNDPNCYKSCQEAMRAISYRQGFWKSQKHFDKSIALCPAFAYSYMEKAVPYLKRGDFITWKTLIDKAVALAPLEYLGYRGWCRLQFLRDYKGAIKDIEELQKISKYDIGYCQTGDYHLIVALALCYKETGQLEKAKTLIENLLKQTNYHLGLYDYYHLGVIELQLDKPQKAIEYFNQQIKINDYLAETYYYLALAHKKLNQQEACLKNLRQAQIFYKSGKIMMDAYAEPIDKIYLEDIENEIKKTDLESLDKG